jgi:hypothetical protein
VIEKISGQGKKAWTKRIGLRLKIFLGESVLPEGMEDRIAFALGDAKLPADFSKPQFWFRTLTHEEKESHGLLYCWHDRWVG